MTIGVILEVKSTLYKRWLPISAALFLLETYTENLMTNGHLDNLKHNSTILPSCQSQLFPA